MKFRSITLAVGLASLCAGFVPGSGWAAPAAGLSWTPDTGLGVERDEPAMFAALQRDLRMSREEALRHLGQQKTAAEVEVRVKEKLGKRYAGSWFSDGNLVVGIADPNMSQVVRAAGGKPEVVKYTMEALDDAAELLRHRPATTAVLGWNADPITNTVAITHRAGTLAEARAWVAAARIDPGMVRYEQRDKEFRPHSAVVAGQPYFATGPGFPCTAGFGVVERLPVTGSAGFVTAGHCGSVGQNAITITEDEFLGQFARSTRGQDNVGDQAYVQLFNPADATFFARDGGRLIVVSGSQEAPLGTAVCLSGGFTRQSCGTVTRQNRMERLPFLEGFQIVGRLIVGMREATFCSVAGDSGGPVLQADQAQGTLVAGLGDCGDPGPTPSLYQPINPVLRQYGLALIGSPESVTPAPLFIDGLFCGQFGVDSIVSCYVGWGGGFDPARVSWDPRPIRESQDPFARVGSMDTYCRGTYPPYLFPPPPDAVPTPVRVTITDAIGQTVSESASVYCAGPVW